MGNSRHMMRKINKIKRTLFEVEKTLYKLKTEIEEMSFQANEETLQEIMEELREVKNEKEDRAQEYISDVTQYCIERFKKRMDEYVENIKGELRKMTLKERKEEIEDDFKAFVERNEQVKKELRELTEKYNNEKEDEEYTRHLNFFYETEDERNRVRELMKQQQKRCEEMTEEEKEKGIEEFVKFLKDFREKKGYYPTLTQDEIDQIIEEKFEPEKVMSQEKIDKIIKETVQEEDKKEPLTKEQLEKLLEGLVAGNVNFNNSLKEDIDKFLKEKKKKPKFDFSEAIPQADIDALLRGDRNEFLDQQQIDGYLGCGDVNVDK